MIEREEVRFIAAADWTNDCRVRIELRKPIMMLTISEAKALRSELDAAIAEAERGADELYREGDPAAFDIHAADAYVVGQAVADRLRREPAR